MIDYRIFEYEGTQVPEGGFKISPSQISNFFEYPKIWYEDNVLELEKSFKGNTSSVLGTALHKIFECALLDAKVSMADMDRAIEEYSKRNPDLDLDVFSIQNLYPAMCTPVVQEYITPLKKRYSNYLVEDEIVYHLRDGIYVAGKVDLTYGTTIADFKSARTKPTCVETGIMPFNYKIQLLAYAYAKQQLGHVIDHIELVYIVRPTKTLAPRCFVVRNEITPKDWKLINDTLYLMVESIEMVRKNPSLIHLIFKSMDLKTEHSTCENGYVNCARR